MQNRKVVLKDRLSEISDHAHWQTGIVLGLLLILLFSFYHYVYGITPKDPQSKENRLYQHDVYDTYTKQALAWHRGEAKLDKDYPYLELAKYPNENGVEEYYVSFPMVPSVVMYFFTFGGNENTPNNLITVLYQLGAFAFAFLLCRRFRCSLSMSFVGAALVCLSSSAFFLSMAGSVWFQAQLFSLFLTMAAFFSLFASGPHKKTEWHISLFLLALAVGCRPMQVFYFPFFLYIILRENKYQIKKMWSYLIAPGAVACVYMWYNYIRFGNILEFGRSYLPEFTRNQEPQFSFDYIKNNIAQIITKKPEMPLDQWIKDNPFGFCFYIANCIFIVLLIACIVKLISSTSAYALKKGHLPQSRFFAALSDSEKTALQTDPQTALSRYHSNGIDLAILLITICIHFFVFLMFRTVGAWQFGARYSVDIIPAVLACILMLDTKLLRRPNLPVIMICTAGMLFNIYGGILLYL